MNFNHPCKELIWVVQPDTNVDYCGSLTLGNNLFNTLGAQPFNYTDSIDALPNAIHSFGGAIATAGTTGSFINASGLFQDPQSWDALYTTGNLTTAIGQPWNFDQTIPNNQAPSTANPESLVSDAGVFVLTETSLDMHCWGQNPVVTAKLQLNGQDRFSEREGTYFDQVQPYQHHTRAPDTGINVYSFALRPEEHQPSGSCNFSRIDNATLQLVLSNATVAGTNTAKVRVYAVNYNVLRVMSGIITSCAEQLAAILDICFLVWVNSVKQIYNRLCEQKIATTTSVLCNQLVSF